MIKVPVNNQRTMSVYQEADKIHCKIESKEEIDTSFEIEEHDFVMLMNYYTYKKSKGEKIF